MRDLCYNSDYYSPSVFDHSCKVEKIAVYLAKKFGGHVEICAVAGQTHDIGAVIFGRNGENGEGHHITGVREAGKILADLYPEWFIKRVQYCIEVHRGSTLNVVRETKEAQICATADAWEHFKNVLELLCSPLMRE